MLAIIITHLSCLCYQIAHGPLALNAHVVNSILYYYVVRVSHTRYGIQQTGKFRGGDLQALQCNGRIKM